MDEPIYRHGWLSIRYVPLRLADMFTALPHLQADWPYVIPRMYVMAIWVTTPAFLLIGFARWRSRLVLASVVGTVAVAVPILLHGGPGYAQFGHRYSLDFMPFLLLLTASGMRGSVSWWKQLLIGLSIAINLWGVIMLSIVRQWAW